jgi:hypothetical protein
MPGVPFRPLLALLLALLVAALAGCGGASSKQGAQAGLPPPGATSPFPGANASRLAEARKLLG